MPWGWRAHYGADSVDTALHGKQVSAQKEHSADLFYAAFADSTDIGVSDAQVVVVLLSSASDTSRGMSLALAILRQQDSVSQARLSR